MKKKSNKKDDEDDETRFKITNDIKLFPSKKNSKTYEEKLAIKNKNRKSNGEDSNSEDFINEISKKDVHSNDNKNDNDSKNNKDEFEDFEELFGSELKKSSGNKGKKEENFEEKLDIINNLASNIINTNKKINSNIIVDNNKNIINTNNENTNPNQKEFTESKFSDNFFEQFESSSDKKDKEKKSNAIFSSKYEELTKEIKRKAENVNFKERLKENGIKLELAQNDEEFSTSSKSNFLECPICANTSQDTSMVFLAINCGHIICKDCWEKYNKINGNFKSTLNCPKCKTEVSYNDVVEINLKNK